MAEPKRIVENICKLKFGVGADQKISLALDVHEALKLLSAESYQNDWHFAMELLQNAEDNTYAPGVTPTIEFLLLHEDVVGVGEPSTLLVLNNEVGFQRENIESLCSIGRSTKRGRRSSSGYIGEKGIGFKSVFGITKRPFVISNGFRICFNVNPTDETDLGFIVPEWIEKPTDAELMQLLGVAESCLPQTIIILPIRADKVELVTQQLHQLSDPLLILFLKKIQRLSITSTPEGSVEKASTTITRTTEFERAISAACKSFTVHLQQQSSGTNMGDGPTSENAYYVWHQQFPVKQEYRIDQRQDVDRWEITLAFPHNYIAQNISVGGLQTAADVYAFLPTKLSTGFPFIINADFLLVSSRETIRFDSPWNKGILSCIPEAFVRAFQFLLTGLTGAPPVTVRSVYNFLPRNRSKYPEFEKARQSIIKELKSRDVILCAADIGQTLPAQRMFYCAPAQACTTVNSFREVLESAHKEGIRPLPGPKFIVDRGLEENYNWALDLFRIPSMRLQDYVHSIDSPGWLLQVSDALYLKVLSFVAGCIKGYTTTEYLSFSHVPLIKYVNGQGHVELATLETIRSCGVIIYKSQIPRDQQQIAKWAAVFESHIRLYFMPEATIQAITLVQQRSKEDENEMQQLDEWLCQTAKVTHLTIANYALLLVRKSRETADPRFVVRVMQFLIHSASQDGDSLPMGWFLRVPLVDTRGIIQKHEHIQSGPHIPGLPPLSGQRNLLLPASVSEWPRLIVDDSWKSYIFDLSGSYLELPNFLGSRDKLNIKIFLQKFIGAVDIMGLLPPNAALPAMKTPLSLTRESVNLLLRWISAYSGQLPNAFVQSVKETEWLKTTHYGYRLPSMSFLDVGQWNKVFEMKDVPFIDNSFYGDLKPFEKTLRQLGVVVDAASGGNAVAKHIQYLANRGSFPMDMKITSRLYSYLQSCDWHPQDSCTLDIWVPVPEENISLGSWKSRENCVISDESGLLRDRLTILDSYYTSKKLLTFFADRLGIARKPGVEEYCRLWLDWCKWRWTVSENECRKVWTVIAQGWMTCPREVVEKFKTECLVPRGVTEARAIHSKEELELIPPDEAFAPDDLILASIFQSAYLPPKFAWFPSNPMAAVWLTQMQSIYSEVGVMSLSKNVTEFGLQDHILACQQIRRLNINEGRIRKGFYQAILAYLAHPILEFSVGTRQTLVRPLMNVVECEAQEPLEVSYILSSPSGSQVTVKRRLMACWLKNQRQIIYLKKQSVQMTKKLALEFNTQFAECITKGLVADAACPMPGLQDFLQTAASYDFDEDAVKLLIQQKNLGLFDEDEAFLSTWEQQARPACQEIMEE